MAHDVFVSYCHQDQPITDAVVAGLEQAGIRCWVAPRDIPGGLLWPEAVAKAIPASRAMVLVLSRDSNSSVQVLQEVERSVNAGLAVLPLRIEPVTPTGGMALFLGSRQWLDALTPPLELHIQRLCTTLRPLLQQAPPEAEPLLPVEQVTVEETPAPKPGQEEPAVAGPKEPLAFWLRFAATNPNRLVRVSMAAIMRIMRGDDEYLLVRNLHRHENFGPFGGVYKHHEAARPALDECRFRPHRAAGSDAAEMRNDLRGFVRARDLPRFLRWYRSGKDREGNPSHRELREELREIDLDALAEAIPPLTFRYVRRVREFAKTVPGQQYAQLRVIDVFELVADDVAAAAFLSHLLRAAEHSRQLLLATQQEIARGRSTGGDPIASHTPYLYGDCRRASEPPPF